ncbi:hypothetical protein AMJ85_09395 [candidate division BRC1 bacterium SM23_51]|nr:MAG: hypothetical protein AMJ85_09395 [candidate division BRC1 bacterium SM23_51]
MCNQITAKNIAQSYFERRAIDDFDDVTPNGEYADDGRLVQSGADGRHRPVVLFTQHDAKPAAAWSFWRQKSGRRGRSPAESRLQQLDKYCTLCLISVHAFTWLAKC